MLLSMRPPRLCERRGRPCYKGCATPGDPPPRSHAREQLLPDPVLLRGLATLVAQDRATTAALLAHLAEVDERRLYLPAAHPSMYAYCIHELHLSEDAVFKRIQVARVARRFPAIFPALADGRLHLSAVVLLAPHLTKENAGELLAAAAHRTKSEVEQVLAERFPRPDVPGLVRALSATELTGLLARGKLGNMPRGMLEHP